MSRRALVAGLGALAAARAVPAQAQSQSPLAALLQHQAVREWENRFDSSQMTVGDLKSNVPLMSPETPLALERAIPLYRDLAARGGWRPISVGSKLRIGSQAQAVRSLRERLYITGDMENPNLGVPDVFDSYVDVALRRFQIRHGLKPTGVIDQATLNMLNVPVTTRLHQMETNLARLQSMAPMVADRFIFVNIPAAELEAVEGGYVVARHTAVVGKPDRQTPVLTSRVHEINFNPFWNVPVSILQKDLVPKLREDPDYFRKFKIRIYDKSGTELQPEQVDWTTASGETLRMRQDPGELNAMGSVKINFHNPHSVYMHDTPFKTLFGDSQRFHSSGCMRIQNVRDLVAWILRDTPEWPRHLVDQAFTSGERIDAKVKNPVPVRTEYVTAWATRNGVVHFRDDIYNLDGVGLIASQDL